METDEIRDLAVGWAHGKLSRADLIRRLAIAGLSVPVALQLLEQDAAAQEETAYWNRLEGSFKGQTLVVTSYGGTWQTFMTSQHIPEFEAHTGAKVELAVGLAVDWFSKMQAAGKHKPPYDVFVANETYLAQLRAEGFFAPLPLKTVPNLRHVPKKLRQKHNVGVLGLIGPLGICYNSDKVKDPPKSWLDLKKYGHDTVIFTIGNSGEPQHVMKMAQILTGHYQHWQAAVNWIAKNLCAARQVDFSGTAQTMLTQGEVTVALIDSPDWALLKAKGLPMKWVQPKEGYCGMFEQDMNVTSGSKVKPLGEAFINYWLSTPVQKKWAEQFYWTPANSMVKLSPKVRPLIPVTQKTLNKVPRWNYLWLNLTGARTKMTNYWTHHVNAC